MSRVTSSLFCATAIVSLLAVPARGADEPLVDAKLTAAVAHLMVSEDMPSSRAASCVAFSELGVQRALESADGESAARGYKFAKQTWAEVYRLDVGELDDLERDSRSGLFDAVVANDDRKELNGHIVLCMNQLLEFIPRAKEQGTK